MTHPTRDAECRLIVGHRGSGKSTLLASLLDGERRVIAWTTKREDFADMVTVRGLKDLKTALRRRWNTKKGFRIRYLVDHIEPGDEAAMIWELHSLTLFLKAIQEPYASGRDSRPIVFAVDEVQRAFPHSRPQGANAFRWAIEEGRSWGLRLWVATQRPTRIPPDFRDNVDKLYVLRLGGDTALKTVSDFTGKGHIPALRKLQKRQVLVFDEDGRHGPMSNKSPLK